MHTLLVQNRKSIDVICILAAIVKQPVFVKVSPSTVPVPGCPATGRPAV